MRETTWIIDKATGVLTVEGLSESEIANIASDLLPAPSHVNCARPVNAPPTVGAREPAAQGEPTLRVYRVYHGSVVEGPGRRSVVQLAGCNLRCQGFIYSLEWAKYDAAHERHQLRTTHF